MRKWFTSLVFPGLLEVRASFLLRHSMFMSDDFPTFDLPMNANSGNFCFGFSEILVLLPENNASVIFMVVSESVGKGMKNICIYLMKYEEHV
jgi:hypothetical protein